MYQFEGAQEVGIRTHKRIENIETEVTLRQKKIIMWVVKKNILILMGRKSLVEYLAVISAITKLLPALFQIIL